MAASVIRFSINPFRANGLFPQPSFNIPRSILSENIRKPVISRSLHRQIERMQWREMGQTNMTKQK